MAYRNIVRIKPVTIGTAKLSSIFTDVNSVTDSTIATMTHCHIGKFTIHTKNATMKNVIEPSRLFMPIFLLPKCVPIRDAVESAKVKIAMEVIAMILSKAKMHKADEKKKNVAEFMPFDSLLVNRNENIFSVMIWLNCLNTVRNKSTNSPSIEMTPNTKIMVSLKS